MNAAICLSFIAISDIPRAATRAEQRHRTPSSAGSTDPQRAQVQILAQVWWGRTALSGGLSSDLPGSSSNPYKQQAHQPCWYTVLLLHQGRLKPAPGAAGEEHTWEGTWPCGHPTWQRPPVLTVSWDQFGSEAIIYKFTYIFCLLPFLSLPWHQKRQLLLPWSQPLESELLQR